MAFASVGDLIVTAQNDAGVPANYREVSNRTQLDWAALEAECLKRNITLPETVARFLALNAEDRGLDDMAEIALIGEQAKMAERLLNKVNPPLRPVDSGQGRQAATFIIEG